MLICATLHECISHTRASILVVFCTKLCKHTLVHITLFVAFCKSKKHHPCPKDTFPSANDIMFLCKTQVDGRVQSQNPIWGVWYMKNYLRPLGGSTVC